MDRCAGCGEALGGLDYCPSTPLAHRFGSALYSQGDEGRVGETRRRRAVDERGQPN